MAEEDGSPAREEQEIDGLTRAAVFAQILGEESASEIFQHLEPKEVQRLAVAIKDLGRVPQPKVERVLASFMSSVGFHSSLGMDAERYVRGVLVRAHGEDKASGIMDRITMGTEASGLENLRWMDARQVSDVIRDEHPQVKAIVLSYLEADHAAAVLSLLPDRARPDVVLRMATLETVQPAALRELNATLEQQVSGIRNIQATSVGGLKAAANVLNYIDGAIEGEIMELIKEQDAELGQRIEDLMFVFDNLIDVDPAGVQALLREVSSESLLLALKGANDALKEKFFSNMSRRAAEMMRDDLEAKGPVRVSEVEIAQKEILSIARRLAEEGQIVLGDQGGDEFI